MKISRLFSLAFLLLAAALLLQACGGEDPFSIDYSQVPPPYDASKAVRDSVLSEGVKIYVLEEGSGPYRITFKDQIVVKYTGRTQKGKVFTSSYGRRRDNDTNFNTTFRNLTPQLIQTQVGRFPPLVKGLRKALLGMKPGEKSIIVVPPEMGSQQRQNGIELKDKTLVYNVKVVRIL